MTTVADLLNKLVQQKKEIVDNLISMGVDSSYEETLESLIPKILTINSGSEKQLGIYPINKNGIPIGNVIVPESVTDLLKSVFMGNTQITNVILPSTLGTIETESFKGCTSLVEVNIGNCHQLGSASFDSCYSLQKIIFDENEPLVLGTYVFKHSGVTDDFVNHLYENDLISGSLYGCFLGCSNLSDITITDFSDLSFSESSVKNVVINSKNLNNESSNVFENSSLETITLNNMNCIGTKFFYQCSKLRAVNLPETLKTIKEYAFGDCSSLTDIKLPNNLLVIEGCAFTNCSSLTTIELPQSLTTILNGAFAGCKSLKSITITKNVTNIGNLVFVDCNDLTDIYIDSPKNESSIVVPNDKWGATNATIHWQKYTINWNITPDENVVIYCEDNIAMNNTYVCENIGNDVTYVIYHPNYLPIVGNIIGQANEIYNINVTLSDTNGYRLTINPNVEDCDITISYDTEHKHSIKANSVLVPIGAEVKYRIKKNGYKMVNDTIVIIEDTTLDITMTVVNYEEVEIITPFTMDDYSINYLENLVDNNNFEISDGYIQNGSSSYNIDNGTSYGYIVIVTPEFETNLEINCKVSSEVSYDYGGIYLGDAIYQPTKDQIKNTIISGNGKWLYAKAGDQFIETITTALQPNTTYYLNFAYAKDSSGNSNEDRFKISRIKFTSAI